MWALILGNTMIGNLSFEGKNVQMTEYDWQNGNNKIFSGIFGIKGRQQLSFWKIWTTQRCNTSWILSMLHRLNTRCDLLSLAITPTVRWTCCLMEIECSVFHNIITSDALGCHIAQNGNCIEAVQQSLVSRSRRSLTYFNRVSSFEFSKVN